MPYLPPFPSTEQLLSWHVINSSLSIAHVYSYKKTYNNIHVRAITTSGTVYKLVREPTLHWKEYNSWGLTSKAILMSTQPGTYFTVVALENGEFHHVVPKSAPLKIGTLSNYERITSFSVDKSDPPCILYTTSSSAATQVVEAGAPAGMKRVDCLEVSCNDDLCWCVDATFAITKMNHGCSSTSPTAVSSATNVKYVSA